MIIKYPEIGICGLSCRLYPRYHTESKNRCGGKYIMIGNQQNQMNRIVLVVLSFLFVIGISMNVTGQVVEDLTDREILIQLIEKFNYLESAVKRLETNSSFVIKEILSIEKSMSENAAKVDSISGKYGETVARWNTLLGLFVTFILGIFIWMWKRVYNGKKAERSK